MDKQQEYINIDPSGKEPLFVKFERVDTTEDGISFYDIFQWGRKLETNEQNYFYLQPECLEGKHVAFGFNENRSLIDIWVEDSVVNKKYIIIGRILFDMNDLNVTIYGIDDAGKQNFEDSWELPIDTIINGSFTIKGGERIESIFKEIFNKRDKDKT